MRGRHRRCPVHASFGLNEYDSHTHQCTRNNKHDGDHDFSECPEGRHGHADA